MIRIPKIGGGSEGLCRAHRQWVFTGEDQQLLALYQKLFPDRFELKKTK